MKTTLDLPDPLFRKAKATAAERGQSLKDFVAEALTDKLERPAGRGAPGWMQGFGKLKRLHKETVRVQSAVDEEFEVIEPEDQRRSSIRTRCPRSLTTRQPSEEPCGSRYAPRYRSSCWGSFATALRPRGTAGPTKHGSTATLTISPFRRADRARALYIEYTRGCGRATTGRRAQRRWTST